MKRRGIDVLYPEGYVDRDLNIVDGNRSLYEVMGEFALCPLYKKVHEADWERLEAAISHSRDTAQPVSAYVRILNGAGEYEDFLIRVQPSGDQDFLHIQLFNMVQDQERMMAITRQYMQVRDYMTMTGCILSECRPADDYFHLFVINNEQTVTLAETTLSKWKERMLAEGKVAGKDEILFETVCEAMKWADSLQTMSFRGSILTDGGREEKHQVKLLPRTYGGARTVLGVWTILEEGGHLEYGSYTEDAYVDSLTRLLNKKTITEYAQRVLEDGRQAAIVVVDIDNFKNVNDTFGHLFGDQVIQQMGDILKRTVGSHGVAGRIGGDEFLVVIEEFDDELNLRNYLRSIKQHFSLLFRDRVGENQISCSIGVARSDVVGSDFKELFMTADRALYLAKQKGKNRYIIFKPELHSAYIPSQNNLNMLQIRKSYYSDADMRKINCLLSQAVISGREVFPALLTQVKQTLMVERVTLMWDGWVLRAEGDTHASAPMNGCRYWECQEYLGMFRESLLVLDNVNTLEYSNPKVFRCLRQKDVFSTMHYLLKDPAGRIRGVLCADECRAVQTFPKVAIRMFESVSQVLGGILTRDDGAT